MVPTHQPAASATSADTEPASSHAAPSPGAAASPEKAGRHQGCRRTSTDPTTASTRSASPCDHPFRRIRSSSRGSGASAARTRVRAAIRWVTGPNSRARTCARHQADCEATSGAVSIACASPGRTSRASRPSRANGRPTPACSCSPVAIIPIRVSQYAASSAAPATSTGRTSAR